MALDLLKPSDTPQERFFFVLTQLAEEAGVCMSTPITDPDFCPYSDGARIHGAFYEYPIGLVVMDDEGRYFRLKVTAEEIKPEWKAEMG